MSRYKDCLIRALRTFGETAVSYFLIHLITFFASGDWTNWDLLKATISGVTVSAISAGFAALLNLPKEEKNDK